MFRRCGLTTSVLGAFAIFALSACQPPDAEGEGETEGSEEGDTDGLPPIDPRICEEMEFDNAIDEAACDEIWGRGIEPELADDVEMCRRLYVDLTGSLPPRNEYKDDCEDRSVEDIVDTGYTLQYLLKTLTAREPASLKTCVLLQKPCLLYTSPSPRDNR